jgi:hypothetical protein
MEHIPSDQVFTKKTNKSHKALKIIPWVGLVLFVAIVVIGGYLYATKRLTFAFGNTATNSTTAVCGDSVIAQYNAAMFYQVRGTDTRDSLDEAGINNLEKDIPKKTGYAQDATCQTILFWIAIHHLDATKAAGALTALKSLHGQGKYVDSNLSSSSSLLTFQGAIDSISVNPQGSQGQ